MNERPKKSSLVRCPPPLRCPRAFARNRLRRSTRSAEGRLDLLQARLQALHLAAERLELLAERGRRARRRGARLGALRWKGGIGRRLPAPELLDLVSRIERVRIADAPPPFLGRQPDRQGRVAGDELPEDLSHLFQRL